jgi:hypothetical protein
VNCVHRYDCARAHQTAIIPFTHLPHARFQTFSYAVHCEVVICYESTMQETHPSGSLSTPHPPRISTTARKPALFTTRLRQNRDIRVAAVRALAQIPKQHHQFVNPFHRGFEKRERVLETVCHFKYFFELPAGSGQISHNCCAVVATTVEHREDGTQKIGKRKGLRVLRCLGRVPSQQIWAECPVQHTEIARFHMESCKIVRVRRLHKRVVPASSPPARTPTSATAA